MTTEWQAVGAALANTWYGIVAEGVALPGEYDHNVRLNSPDGSRHVLKIMHAGADAALVALQVDVLRHLARVAPELAVPRVVPSRDGASSVAVSVDGVAHIAWLLEYLPGEPLAGASPRSPALLDELGAWLGQLDVALRSFASPAAHRSLKWDLAAALWIAPECGSIADPARRALVGRAIADYRAVVVPRLASLPRGIIHNDANDHNVLIARQHSGASRISGLIDFGDTLDTITVAEPAIAAAYAAMGAADPLQAVAALVAGYHRHRPLSDDELAVLLPLVRMRLAVSVVNSALRARELPDDPYVTVSEAPAWQLLQHLDGIHPRFGHAAIRAACGLEPLPAAARLRAWLAARAGSFAPVFGTPLHPAEGLVLDLGVGSTLLGADPANARCDRFAPLLAAHLAEHGARFGVGGYDEARLIYTSERYESGSHPTDERRTIHLGVDLWVPAGTPVYAPLDGTVVCVAENPAPLDYGPLVILAHTTDDGDVWHSLYGHLGRESLTMTSVGQAIRAGQQIGVIGAPPVNGDWPPHLHAQIIMDLLDLGQDYPGVGAASQRATWLGLSPDPSVLLGVPPALAVAPPPSPAETLARRRARLGHNLSISYRRPLKVVRGWMQYLYDETGRAYLDIYNNVPHVGHSHPRVVRAVQRQIALLNTNTRYLHDTILTYAERLCALLPAPLSVCYFVNSASEANELALRLARAATGQRDMIVLDAAYHGHTTGLIDISPYKFAGPGGAGQPDWVQVVPIPDDYRGPYRRGEPALGQRYAAHVAEAITAIAGHGRGLAGFIAESLPSVGGQIVPPDGYLAHAYHHVRAAGGICIADEVQVGFGRLGAAFWGFALQGVVPDIVVLGKPIGNAFPLGAVVTTPAIAAAFDNGMEYFSTFGGNPVACAAGLAVLDVLRDEGLPQRAARLGTQLIGLLRQVQQRHPCIGDVRGVGLFLGVEIVTDPLSRVPDGAAASAIVNRMRDYGILAGTDGPHHNVIKIRPPLAFDERDAEVVAAVLDRILCEDGLRR